MNKGFTSKGLIAVVVIIGIVAAFVLPKYLSPSKVQLPKITSIARKANISRLKRGKAPMMAKDAKKDIRSSMAARAHGNTGWQECDKYPCQKECRRAPSSGTCMGTYNENGSYTETLCRDGRDGKKNCMNFVYDEKGNRSAERHCKEVDAQNNCTAYVGGMERVYDNAGHVTIERHCSAWGEDGKCSQSHMGMLYTYNKHGKKISQRQCHIWNGNTCTQGGPVREF